MVGGETLLPINLPQIFHYTSYANYSAEHTTAAIASSRGSRAQNTVYLCGWRRKNTQGRPTAPDDVEGNEEAQAEPAEVEDDRVASGMATMILR